jgi:hypothetical protein
MRVVIEYVFEKSSGIKIKIVSSFTETTLNRIKRIQFRLDRSRIKILELFIHYPVNRSIAPCLERLGNKGPNVLR